MKCRESKRLTPFNPRSLTPRDKDRLQDNVFVASRLDSRGESEKRLASWTHAHKQAWELEQMNNPGPARYELNPPK